MFIVTDLTRFASGNPNVCTALVNMETGACVRPMPYFTYQAVRRSGVIPGAVFTGDFVHRPDLSAPHTEDCGYSNLNFRGPATREDFRSVLVNTLSDSISAGFEFVLAQGAKVIPPDHRGPRSIVTIRVDPANFTVHADQFNRQKIKANFVDGSGQSFRYMPITDLGFFDHALAHHEAGDLAELNDHIRGSEEVLLRVGLSRPHTSPDGRCGYWIQVNGIYTFPSRLDVLRGYGQ